MKKLFLIFTLAFGIVLILDSCATQRNGKRKCDGKRSIRTPMGNM